jgi:DNA-binding GntR family transcriptional regulator
VTGEAATVTNTGTATVAIARPRASDVAYQRLREMILDLRLPPGTVVNEHDLAAGLGLGRMPVREAIARLASDRFVVVHPRRSTLVASFGLDDILAMFDAREAIECGVAHIAARRADATDLATLRQLVQDADRAREGTDHEAFLRDDHEIHAFLLRMIHNPLLQDAADRLLLHNLRFWRSHWAARPARHATMIPHADLLAALEDHDPGRAEAAMREHIAASRRLLKSCL